MTNKAPTATTFKPTKSAPIPGPAGSTTPGAHVAPDDLNDVNRLLRSLTPSGDPQPGFPNVPNSSARLAWPDSTNRGSNR